MKIRTSIEAGRAGGGCAGGWHVEGVTSRGPMKIRTSIKAGSCGPGTADDGNGRTY
jgi:hypothetical protein